MQASLRTPARSLCCWPRLAGVLAGGRPIGSHAGTLLGDSTRQTADAAFADTGSLHPLNLVQLARAVPVPDARRRSEHARAGAVRRGRAVAAVRLAAGPAPTLGPISRRWCGRLCVCGALALLLAAGRVWRTVPFAVAQFRWRIAFAFPAGRSCWCNLCVAVGAASPWRLIVRLLQPGDRERRSTARLSALLARAFWPAWRWRSSGRSPGREYVAGALARLVRARCSSASAACLIALVERGVRGAAVALVLFTAVDLSVYGLSYSRLGRTADLHEFVAGVALPPRVRRRSASPCRRAAPDRERATACCWPGSRASTATPAWSRPSGSTTARPPALRLAGVGWVCKPSDRTAENASRRLGRPLSRRAAARALRDARPSAQEHLGSVERWRCEP